MNATKMQAAVALGEMRGFMGPAQLAVFDRARFSEERQFFYDKAVEMAERIKAMPKTYEQDGLGMEAVAHLHYFTASCDWYITEKDMEAEQHQAFGLADIGWGGELGYISIVELLANGAELDLYFQPATLAAIAAKAAV